MKVNLTARAGSARLVTRFLVRNLNLQNGLGEKVVVAKSRQRVRNP